MKARLGLLGVVALAGCAGGGGRGDDVAACTPAPLGELVLHLRGSMNSWGADEDHAFAWSCDAYFLNVDLEHEQEFKIADAGWTPATSFGSDPNDPRPVESAVPAKLVADSAPGKSAHIRHGFSGAHTLTLRFVDGQPSLSIGPRSFIDPGARPVDDPRVLGARFDSRDPAHKQPFGAVVAGTSIDYALATPVGVDAVTLVIEARRLEGNQEVLEYRESARVPMRREGTATGLLWRAAHRHADIGVHGYWFELQAGDQRYAYHNNRDGIFWTRERGSGGVGELLRLPEQARRIRRYRQTVYDPAYAVPDHAPDIVWYYIFPERFRNGDPGNDPQPGVQAFEDGTVELHADWNQRPYRNGSGDGSDGYYANDFFGGDLAGITEKLDDIADLGANAIYMTPVFAASSNHKYDTADYRRIDPGFGSEADFRRLTAEAARRGIRVVIDASLNHSGRDSVYFDRYARHPGMGAYEGGEIRADSPFADWYRFNPEADPPYTGWTGVANLPDLDDASASFRDFAFGPDGVMQHWLDAGAAGWRMDVAPWVPDDFWRDWRRAIKAHRPDALLVAETWFDASKYLLGDSFDSTMNYIFRNTAIEYAKGGDARRLVVNLEHLREAYPPQAHAALMNLLSTHDQARTLHLLGGVDRAADPGAFALARERFRLALLLQMTYPGTPAIYYGDEVGLTGGDDPDNRRTYPWADLGGEPDLALRTELRKLVRMRHDHPVLRRGSLDAPLYVDEQAIVWLRRLDGVVAIVALNNGAGPIERTIELPADLSGVSLRDALGGDEAAAAGRKLAITIPPRFGRVLIGD